MKTRSSVLRLVSSVIFSSVVGSSSEAATEAEASITVVLTGEPTLCAKVRSSLEQKSDLPLELRFSELPNSAQEVVGAQSDIDGRLARARAQYIDGAFDRCVSEIGEDTLVRDLLGARQREKAARVLLWRVGCHLGRGQKSDAASAAHELTTLGLEIPSEVDAVSPEVENVLASAMKAAASGQRASVQIAANRERSSVSIDGRDAACSTPCNLELAIGDHVVKLEADGAVPEVRIVRADGPTSAQFDLVPATPELASEQWMRRYAASAVIDSTPSVQLLATAMRTERLVVIVAESELSAVRLRSALAVEGQIAARAERRFDDPDDLSDESSALLRDLLVDAKILEPAPTIIESPWFWVAIGVVAAAAAGTTAFFLVERDKQTGLGFKQ